MIRLILVILLVAAVPAMAGEREDLERLRETTLGLIRALVEQGLLTREKADALLRATEPVSPQAAEPKTEPERKVVRVPYVPETVKQEIREQIKEDVVAQAKAEGWAQPNTFPDWLNRISLEGDLRLRYQHNGYQNLNAPAPIFNAITGSNLNNTTNDESQYRIRARMGLLAQVSPDISAKLSVATGNAQSPISLNQDFGNYYSGYSVQLDNAYARYRPNERFTASLGRMPRPFYSTELVFWDDLVFDGVAATARSPLFPGVDGFLTLGGFLLQAQGSTPTTPNPKAKSLLAAQFGNDFKLGRNARLKLAAAYYDYENVQGEANTIAAPNASDWTVPKFLQKGNSLFDINAGTGNASKFALASKFKELNLTAALDLLHFEPYLVRVSGDYVKNIGFDADEILARTGSALEPRTKGYQAQLQFGTPEVQKLNDWQFSVLYRYLQRDATLDAFNDPDSYLGGTNYKGYTLGLRYGLAKNTWIRLRWMSADEIDGPPLAIDVLQVDFNVKF